jgi:hypothetical protein
MCGHTMVNWPGSPGRGFGTLGGSTLEAQPASGAKSGIPEPLSTHPFRLGANLIKQRQNQLGFEILLSERDMLHEG